ncbi:MULTISPECIES: hypothetical protein [Paraburkholderia]|uniref:hypothetical protein n=1 Tax=Paraburkholderia TaxID=1822464 RepID=UPI001CB13A92|nr:MULTISPECIES: hypothetical protein [Paraburkholderia]CAG9222350.1 conserved hypothetical protein [Paraburkholderia caribensis]
MLFTDAKWAESSDFRKAIAKPYQPWCCVGWTDEAVCFWVFPDHASNLAGELPDGLLVAGPHVLLDVIGQMAPTTFSVYVMQVGIEGRPVALQQVTGLWSQPGVNGLPPDYWYRTDEGDLVPCSRFQQHVPGDAPLELAFGPEGLGCSDADRVAV